MQKELSYIDRNHRFGRIFLGIALVIIILVPVCLALVLGESPDWKVVLASIPAMIVYIGGGFVEVSLYGPLLGTCGTYLGFFTGNLVNLKVPCAVNARDQLGDDCTEEEKEIASCVSVATSTIVTTLIMGIGVLALTPLRPVLESPVLTPGFATAFTALFGALAYKYFTKNPKLVPIPFVLAVVLQYFLKLGTSILIPLTVLLSILFALLLYKKNKL